MASLVLLMLAGRVAGEVAQVQSRGAVLARQPGQEASVAEAAQQIASLEPLTATSSKFSNSSDAMSLLDLIYEGHSQHAFWSVGNAVQAESQVANLPAMERRAIAYGEIKPKTFMQLLAHAGAQAGQKYYDLGSGTGKTVVAAWLLGLDATGVELIDKRFTTACGSLLVAKRLGFRKLAQGPGLNFIHGSFLDVDFSDADILFADSSLFSKTMMANLTRSGSRMKPGSKIISSSGFPGDNFRTEGLAAGPTSRKQGSTWTIQTVLDSANNSPASKNLIKPASLMRQEPNTAPKALPAYVKPIRKKHINWGPTFGAMTLPTVETVSSGTKVCALATGDTTGIAKAQLEGAAKK